MEEKVYTTRGSKISDFLIGFFLVGSAFSYAMKFVLTITGYAQMVPVLAGAVVAFVVLAFYLYQKRKFMGIGMFSLLALQVVAGVALLLPLYLISMK